MARIAVTSRVGVGLAALAMAAIACGESGPTATPTPVTTTTQTTTLGPEWRQQDGRVLIEAVASGDPQQLLADLVALGLTDGVVAGRLVNGWLPVEAFDQALQLPSLQFVQPTGAGTGG